MSNDTKNAPGVTAKSVVMEKIDAYMSEKKYKISKEFYDGVTTDNNPGGEKTSFITKNSMRVLLEQLSKEDLVDLYVGFLRFYTQIEQSEAEEAKRAEEAAKRAQVASSGVTIEHVPDEEDAGTLKKKTRAEKPVVDELPVITESPEN